MSSGDHLLQKVTFEVNLTKQEGAFEIQNRISTIFSNKILPELGRLFDEKIGTDRVIAVDKLEINLGNISSAQLEEEIEIALKKEINNFLDALVTDDSHSESQRHEIKQRKTIRWNDGRDVNAEVGVSITTQSESYFERVTQFLLTGVSSASAQSQSSGRLTGMLHFMLSQHPERFVAFLRSNADRLHLFQRLVLNLSASQLTYLLSLLGCANADSLGRKLEEMAKLLEKLGVSAASLTLPGNIRFPDLLKWIWGLVLIRFTGSGTSGSITRLSSENTANHIVADQVRILTDVLLIIERLSERSLFETSGNLRKSIRDYQLSTELKSAVEAVSLHIRKDKSGNSTTDSIVQPTLASERAMLENNAGLLKNSLFTLPDPLVAPLITPLRTEEIPGSDTGIYINNAGLIILAPFLKPFFARLGFLDGNSFASIEAQWRAVHVLQHACGFSAEIETGESDMIFNKLICGLAIHDAVPEDLELTPAEAEETQNLLQSVLQHWTLMNRSSVFALQSTFFQKQGRLSITGKDWDLLIERDSAVEILIDKLPWTIGIVKFPWTDYSINTTW